MSLPALADPPTAGPDPGRIVGMITAFEQTAALSAALRVGLFTAIAGGADTVELLAERCDCAPRAARILADVLSVHGLLVKTGGRYALAADAAAFLDQAAPGYIGEAARFLASPEKIALCFDDPEGWVRRGGPASLANVTPESSVWVDFARGMANFMAPTTFAVARLLKTRLTPPPGRILDVAAGHGLFGVACLQAFPDAHAVALDWPAVLTVAQETARAAGVVDRWTAQPGDAFDLAAANAYDLVLIPNFLHHFDPQTCVEFLVQVATALRPGGMAAIVEYTPDDSRTSPPAPAVFAFSMLVGTPAGDAYTAQALGDMCARAGLGLVAVEPAAHTVQTVILACKDLALQP